MELNEINDRTPEGRLLLMAIGLLSATEPYTSWTPDEILARLEETALIVYEGRIGAAHNEPSTAEHCQD